MILPTYRTTSEVLIVIKGFFASDSLREAPENPAAWWPMVCPAAGCIDDQVWLSSILLLRRRLQLVWACCHFGCFVTRMVTLFQISSENRRYGVAFIRSSIYVGDIITNPQWSFGRIDSSYRTPAGS